MSARELLSLSIVHSGLAQPSVYDMVVVFNICDHASSLAPEISPDRSIPNTKISLGELI